MRFLADQDVWKATVDLIKALGHDVVTASEIGMARASDRELLTEAKRDKRLLVTRDTDFGSLVFLGEVPSAGVILLRIMPETIEKVHSELTLVFEKHSEEKLRKYFCTVEPKRHRMRLILSSGE